MTSVVIQDTLIADAIKWRRDFHAHPELGYQELRTSDRVAQLLESFGLEVHRSLGGTGLVGILENGPGPSIGLRADMDALPIQEDAQSEHCSRHDGCMHACGHDGHTCIILATAKYLSETRKFVGRVVFIFQPAEETGGGAKRMIEDGLFERFPVDYVYALHNWPGIPQGSLQVNPRAMMASQDMFDIVLQGKGCHAAMPHTGLDPVVVAGQLVTGLQTLVSRRISPFTPVVLSVTAIDAGTAYNVIPDSATLRGTVRCLNAATREQVEALILEMANNLPEAFGLTATVDFRRGYPVTLNDPVAARRVQRVAQQLLGEANVIWDHHPSMATEDFSYMLQSRPGAYFWLGSDAPGRESVPLHNPRYDFNDALVPIGVQLMVGLVTSHSGGLNDFAQD